MKVKAPVSRAGIPLLLAAVYLGCLVWQAPHTVHHFFERETEKPNECAANAAAERSVGTSVEPVTVLPVTAVVVPADIAGPAVVTLLALELPASRAPPRRSA